VQAWLPALMPVKKTISASSPLKDLIVWKVTALEGLALFPAALAPVPLKNSSADHEN
jgi:hypothetical protein